MKKDAPVGRVLGRIDPSGEVRPLALRGSGFCTCFGSDRFFHFYFYFSVDLVEESGGSRQYGESGGDNAHDQDEAVLGFI